MSRLVPKADPWSRLNAIESRMTALERVPQANGSSVWDFSGSLFNSSSSTWESLAGAPSVDVQIGPSGLAVYTLSADVTTPGAGEYALLTITGDGPGGGGFSTGDGALLTAESDAGVLHITQTSVGSLANPDPLTPGDWTFSLLFRAPSGGTAQWENVFLQITPL